MTSLPAALAALTVVTDAWYAELSIDDDDMAYGSSSIMRQLISDNVVTVG